MWLVTLLDQYFIHIKRAVHLFLRPSIRLGYGSTVWCSYRDIPNDPLELVPDIYRLFRYTVGHPGLTNRARLVNILIKFGVDTINLLDCEGQFL